MSKNELRKRYLLFILGLFFSGLGVAITKRGELGVSPISSVPNVMSYKFPVYTLGTWLLIWNCVLLLGQIIILRRQFKLIQLLQIPLSILFGWFTDFGLWVAQYIPNKIYIVRLLLVIGGITVLAFGITLTVLADVVMNSGEAFVKAISDQTNMQFGNVKTCFDITCLVAAVILSFVFFDFQLIGTREGTIIAALISGTIIKMFQRMLKEPIEKMLMVRK